MQDFYHYSPDVDHDNPDLSHLALTSKAAGRRRPGRASKE
jgi:hypothetical protein